jgi:hypothetical protein
VIAMTLLRGSTDCSDAARGVIREPSKSVSVGASVPSLRPLGSQEVKCFGATGVVLCGLEHPPFDC